MEDAPEDDRDVKLQKASSDLIADFDRSLTPFLRKPNGELRTRVRISETARLTSTVREPDLPPVPIKIGFPSRWQETGPEN